MCWTNYFILVGETFSVSRVKLGSNPTCKKTRLTLLLFKSSDIIQMFHDLQSRTFVGGGLERGKMVRFNNCCNVFKTVRPSTKLIGLIIKK